MAPAPTDTPGDLQSQLEPAVYDRIIRPIESKLAEAAMARDIIRQESEKPADKRNAALIVSMKEREAGFYIGASLAAVEGAAQMTTPPLKNAVIEQFEKPNRLKAIAVLNDVAAAAVEQKDYTRTAAIYKRILALDPDNQPAKDALRTCSRKPGRPRRRRRPRRGRDGSKSMAQFCYLPTLPRRARKELACITAGKLVIGPSFVTPSRISYFNIAKVLS